MWTKREKNRFFGFCREIQILLDFWWHFLLNVFTPQQGGKTARITKTHPWSPFEPPLIAFLLLNIPCHSSFSDGIIYGPHPGSFAVQFGDHFWSGGHLRSGIICGAVRCCLICIWNTNKPFCFPCARISQSRWTKHGVWSGIFNRTQAGF